MTITVIKNTVPFDYNAIETPLVSRDKCSDERLLRQIKGLDLINSNVGGWGLIAELCKRFEEVTK